MGDVFVIAEAGSCHDGDLEKACELIFAAKDAGADACKFQFWSSTERMIERRRAPEYRAVYEKGRVPLEWLPLLKAECDRRRIEFMCSTYLPEDVEVVMPYVSRMKIASFEAADSAHLVAHRPALAAGKLIYVSLGMGAGPQAVWRWLLSSVKDDIAFGDNIRFMHCVSAYPAPLADLNLSRISSLSELQCECGFSDHSAPEETWTGALAVAAGATSIERHLRLDSTLLDNPDYGHAQSPRQFRQYVVRVRLAQQMMGDGSRGMRTSEQAMSAFRVTGEPL